MTAANTDPADSVSGIEADIEQTRDELGRTVDALKEKFDVKAQARHKVHDVKEAATDERGKPKPAVPIGGAFAAAAAVVVVWLWRRR